MDDISVIIAELDGISLIVGLIAGLLAGIALLMLTRNGMRRTFAQALAEQKSTFNETHDETKQFYEGAINQMKASFDSLSIEALRQNQESFLNLAKDKFDDQAKQHNTSLEGKKELIDMRLETMSASVMESLKKVPTELEKSQRNVSEAMDKSTAQVKETNLKHLNQLTEKAAAQTREHVAELDEKKKLIDQQLKQMSETLKIVPSELEKSQSKVNEVLQQSTEQLKESNQNFLRQIEEKSEAQTKEHIAELESKKKLIDQQLNQMSDTLKIVPNELEKNQNKVNEVLQQSTKQLKESNQNYLNQLTEKSEAQTKEHIAELESKKKLIDQQLEQISTILAQVPTQLESTQNKVTEVLDKSTKNLEETAKKHLTQLQERAETQTEKHSTELESKKELIDQRLTEMDVKLGKVERLISEFESARESKLGALDDQLKNLTQTTSALQQALADNRARGKWGERIAEDILRYMGMMEGVNYRKQLTNESGNLPDFTFLLPNQMSLNMDSKFPLDNYMKYLEAENDTERNKHRQDFLRNVEKHVTDITKKDYIHPGTVDCVLIFIPNEQIYRFIHENGNSIIDKALQQKIILCSPLTLYIVLAVIRQAAQNFNIEQKSREIIKLVSDIRFEWSKYASEMDKLERNFSIMHNRFKDLNGVRTRKLGSSFDKVDNLIESNMLEAQPKNQIMPLPEEVSS